MRLNLDVTNGTAEGRSIKQIAGLAVGILCAVPVRGFLGEQSHKPEESGYALGTEVLSVGVEVGEPEGCNDDLGSLLVW